jgi:RNA polymerase sigma-B factor
MRAMDKAEARALSDSLFRRLSTLPPGTPDHRLIRDTLIELNMPLVRFVAAAYRHRSADADDVLQVGTIGLIKAVDGYDHRRGAEFVTYAIPTIVGEIKRFFRDTSWPLRVPRSLQELYLQVARGSDRLEQRLGRLPTPEELGEDLDLSPSRVVAGFGVGRAYRSHSLEALREAEADEYGTSLLDRLGEYDHNLELIDFLVAVRPLLDALPARERTVLLLRFWGNLTQSQIAERIGVSQMHISRIMRATLRLLREQLEDRQSDHTVAA